MYNFNHVAIKDIISPYNTIDCVLDQRFLIIIFLSILLTKLVADQRGARYDDIKGEFKAAACRVS